MPAGGGRGFEKWRRKDLTQKGETTGSDRVASNVEVSERGDIGWG